MEGGGRLGRWRALPAAHSAFIERRQPEVDQLQLRRLLGVLVQQILQLDVSVDHTMPVAVLDSGEKL